MKKLMGIAAMAILAGGAGAAFAPATADTTVPVDDKYVNVGEDHTGVYEESNGCADLQTHAGDCDGDGDEDAADNKLV